MYVSASCESSKKNVRKLWKYSKMGINTLYGQSLKFYVNVLYIRRKLDIICQKANKRLI